MKIMQCRPFPTEQDWEGEVEVEKNDEGMTRESYNLPFFKTSLLNIHSIEMLVFLKWVIEAIKIVVVKT